MLSIVLIKYSNINIYVSKLVEIVNLVDKRKNCYICSTFEYKNNNKNSSRSNLN